MMEAEAAPTFPPLLSGEDAGAEDPVDRASALAALGCDAGTVVFSLQADRLRAALVFAPEVPLEEAMAMLPLCGVGLQNALGALGPAELAVHLGWDGGIFVNGASCGRLRVRASAADPAAVPDWLVVGIELPLVQTEVDPGVRPDVTALYDEGCADLDPVRLLESWARHTLVWINRWSGEGARPLHAEWMGLARGVGEPVEIAGRSGTFLGVDERFGLLLRTGTGTELIPLSSQLEDF